MKKALMVMLVVALVAGAGYAYMRFLHVEDPGDAYLRTVSAAMLGDEQLFVDGFTKESRPLVAGLLALSRGRDPKRVKSHPYYYLVSENIDEVVVDEDIAWLTVRRAGDKGTRGGYDIKLVKDQGTWKIDALAFNAKRRKTDKSH